MDKEFEDSNPCLTYMVSSQLFFQYPSVKNVTESLSSATSNRTISISELFLNC
jgi:hypothetical protein